MNIRVFFAALFLACFCGDAYSCGRCGNYSSCRYASYSYPTSYSYPYTDNRLVVTYNIAFPSPAVSGATQYAYHSLDPNAAIAGFQNYALRQQETGQYALQQAQTIFQQSSVTEELRARSVLLEKLTPLLSAVPSGGSVSYSFSRDTGGKLSFQQSGNGPVRGGEPLTVGTIISKKCLSCHNPTKKDGGLDFTVPETFTPEVGRKILTAISRNDEKRMPKGGTLSDEEIYVVYEAYMANAKPAEGKQ